MSNSLDPDQARHSVGPDLGPNCLQSLPADKIRWQKVKSQLQVVTSWNIKKIRCDLAETNGFTLSDGGKTFFNFF